MRAALVAILVVGGLAMLAGPTASHAHYVQLQGLRAEFGLENALAKEVQTISRSVDTTCYVFAGLGLVQLLLAVFCLRSLHGNDRAQRPAS
jgi:hypothetical protein